MLQSGLCWLLSSAWRRLGAGLLLAALLLQMDSAQRTASQPAPPAFLRGTPGSPGVGELVLADRGVLPMPPDTPAAHASTLLALPASHASALQAFWFAGSKESAADVQIATASLDRATRQWTPAQWAVNRHTLGAQLGFGIRRLGNPVAWLDQQQRVHLFVVATGLGGWAASRVLHLRQAPSPGVGQAAQFEPLGVLPLSWLWNTSFLVRTAPLALADGGMLLPVHFELGLKLPYALRFDADGRFLGGTRISRRHHLLQPSLLPLTASHALALMRSERGHVGVAQTHDGGQSWADLPDLSLVNPDASVAALALAPGRLLLAHNASPRDRTLLDLSTSGDGLQWQHLHTLAQGGAGTEYSYPALAWADGSLWLSYTDLRRAIAWQRFAPEPASR